MRLLKVVSVLCLDISSKILNLFSFPTLKLMRLVQLQYTRYIWAASNLNCEHSHLLSAPPGKCRNGTLK